ncbi:MAG: VWA domain-containing protein [Blastocatellia bacterium]|nr:VWA domain-containing protein [Blastocatellia bacterium]
MIQIRKTFSTLFLLSLLLLPVASAQQSEEPVVVRVDTDLVAVDLTVKDKEGNFILDLSKDDFEILENGEVKKVEFFQNTRSFDQSPLALVFALDLSGSLSEEETVVSRRSIAEFIEMLDSNSVCGLIAFNNKIEVLENFTDNKKKLSKTLQKIKGYGGSTRIYDAIDRAITMLKKAPVFRSGKRLRRVIVVVTDGFDSSSVIDRKEVSRRARDNGVTVYTITLPSYSPTIGNALGQQRLPTLLDISGITEKTGGRDFTVQNNNYTEVFNGIAKEIASGYMLAYHPSQNGQSGEFRKLEVKVKRDGLIIQTNRDGFLFNGKE